MGGWDERMRERHEKDRGESKWWGRRDTWRQHTMLIIVTWFLNFSLIFLVLSCQTGLLSHWEIKKGTRKSTYTLQVRKIKEFKQSGDSVLPLDQQSLVVLSYTVPINNIFNIWLSKGGRLQFCSCSELTCVNAILRCLCSSVRVSECVCAGHKGCACLLKALLFWRGIEVDALH